MAVIYECYIGKRLIGRVEAENQSDAITSAKRIFIKKATDSEWNAKRIK